MTTPAPREMLRRILAQGRDGRSRKLPTVREALGAARAHRRRPCLLDLMMPGVDGFEVLEAMRHEEAWRDIPVIILTAKELTHEESALLERRTLAVVEKRGLERDVLLQEVRRALTAARPVSA